MTLSQSPQIAPIRVLLVEDSASDARLIIQMLKDVAGDEFDLERVDRLEPALRRLGDAWVDVVLLNLDLPDSGGLATFERTRRAAGREPIVIISAQDDERLALEAVRAGAQDYLVKGRIEGRFLAQVLRHAIERHRIAERLHWLTLAVDQSPASVFITDPGGRIQYVNARFTEVTGYSPDEAIGQTPRILKSGLTAPEYYAALWKAILGGQTWRAEVQNRRKNGEIYWDSVVISPIRNRRGAITHFLAVQEDITRRKESEQARTASEAHYRTILEHIGDAVFVADADGRFVDVNPRASELTGYNRDELLRMRVGDTYPPEAQVQAADRVAAAWRGELPLSERPLRRKDGTVITVEVYARPLPGGLLLGTMRNVTERLELERQLRQAQKMEAVGRLAGGVAHDFNNLLTAIFSYADFAVEELPPESPVRDDIAEIRSAAARASALTRQLLAFSRQQVLEPVVLSLNDLVADLNKMLQRLIGEDVELRLSLAPDVGNVKADPGQIEQVLMNLVVNARDAMPTGGGLLIETTNAELSEQYAEQHHPVVPGHYVMVAVTDTGIGMSAETKARIFEPFFTTKEKGKGTGLGLSTVYGIVKQSGGYIWVYSELRRGTTFKVYLPRVDEAKMAAAPRREPESLRGTETILLAEDDPTLRTLATEVFEKLGYTVLAAADAEEALARAAAHAGPIHLLVTDVVMPGLSGRELAQRLAVARPETRALYISGYTDDAIVHHGMLAPGLAFLQKPFTPAILARKVREVLESG